MAQQRKRKPTATNRPKPKPKPEVVLSDEQSDVVAKLLDRGSKIERERILKSLRPYYGQGKFLDLDTFIDTLSGEQHDV